MLQTAIKRVNVRIDRIALAPLDSAIQPTSRRATEHVTAIGLSQCPANALDGSSRQMKRQRPQRGIVPDEEYIVTTAVIIGPRHRPPRRLEMMHRVGAPCNRHIPCLQQSDTEIALFAHIEEVLSIPAERQKRITTYRVACTKECVDQVGPVPPRSALADSVVEPNIYVRYADCANPRVIKFSERLFDGPRRRQLRIVVKGEHDLRTRQLYPTVSLEGWPLVTCQAMVRKLRELGFDEITNIVASAIVHHQDLNRDSLFAKRPQ